MSRSMRGYRSPRVSTEGPKASAVTRSIWRPVRFSSMCSKARFWSPKVRAAISPSPIATSIPAACGGPQGNAIAQSHVKEMEQQRIRIESDMRVNFRALLAKAGKDKYAIKRIAGEQAGFLVAARNPLPFLCARNGAWLLRLGDYQSPHFGAAGKARWYFQQAGRGQAGGQEKTQIAGRRGRACSPRRNRRERESARPD